MTTTPPPATGTKIYSYRVRLSSNGESGLTELHDQLHLAHKYYNQLTEIERQRRLEFREMRTTALGIADLETELAALTEQIESKRKELRSLRGAARKRVADRSIEATIRSLSEQRKALGEKLRSERQRAKTDPAVQAQTKAIDERALERIRVARGQSQLYWGTYMMVEDATRAARKAKKDPKFKRFTGNGRVGIHVQGKVMPTEHLALDNTMIRVTPLPPDTWDTRSGRRHARTPFMLRINSSDTGKPVWLSGTVLLHRPIPDGLIKWAWVKIERVGLRYLYSLQLTIESAAFVRPEIGGDDDDRRAAAAVDLGWRKMPDGSLRVGYLRDTTGHTEELRLPKEIPERVALAYRVQGFNDAAFNQARTVLAQYLTSGGTVPEWLPERTQTLGQWRSHGHLARLALDWALALWPEKGSLSVDPYSMWLAWKRERLAAKLDLFDTLEVISRWLSEKLPDSTSEQRLVFYLLLWRYKSNHLYRLSVHLQRRQQLHRRELFRQWALKIERRYAAVVMENIRLQDFDLLPPAEEPSGQQQAKGLYKEASPGLLREEIVSRLGKQRVHLLDDKNTTRECHCCGHTNRLPEAATQIMQQCEACGQWWDQDDNAAAVLLKRWSGSESTPPARKNTKVSENAA